MQVHCAAVHMGVKNTSCIGSLLPLCSCCSALRTPCYMACELLAFPISAFRLMDEHLQVRAKCLTLLELWGTQVWVVVQRSFHSLSPIASVQLSCFSYQKSCLSSVSGLLYSEQSPWGWSMPLQAAISLLCRCTDLSCTFCLDLLSTVVTSVHHCLGLF